MKIYNDVTELIGTTPLVYYNNDELAEGVKIALKLEAFNPTGSIKDRIALAMVEDAENTGKIQPGATIIEATSGNTGIGLAMVCATKGYKLIIVMPEHMSIERRKIMQAYGAELILTPKEGGMNASIMKANEIQLQTPNSVILKQFDNSANPAIHYKNTGKEIWNDTDGKVDIFIAGVGTGGTISGCSKYLKEQNPNIKTIAVEPSESSVISGNQPGPHGIQGIGAGFIPNNLDTNLVDDIYTIETSEAIKTAKMAANMGFGIGISSGAALKAAIYEGEKPENKNKLIVVIIPDGVEKYLSTPLFQS